MRKKEKKGENATTKRETEQAKEGTMEGAREGGRQPNLVAAVQHLCLTSSPLTFSLLLPQKSSSPVMTGRQIWPRRGGGGEGLRGTADLAEQSRRRSTGAADLAEERRRRSESGGSTPDRWGAGRGGADLARSGGGGEEEETRRRPGGRGMEGPRVTGDPRDRRGSESDGSTPERWGGRWRSPVGDSGWRCGADLARSGGGGARRRRGGGAEPRRSQGGEWRGG